MPKIIIGDNMNEEVLNDVKKSMKENFGYEIIKDDVLKVLDIRTFDEVVEDNLNYWEVGDLPIEYIDTEVMVANDNDYEQVGDMFWKNAFFLENEDDVDLLESGYIKKINKNDNEVNKGFEEYIYDLCRDFGTTASIEYHTEKPIIANGFEYGMDKQFDNEMSITFPTQFNAITEFLEILNRDCSNNDNCYWIEHYSDEIMKEYDHLFIWWKN